MFEESIETATTDPSSFWNVIPHGPVIPDREDFAVADHDFPLSANASRADYDAHYRLAQAAKILRLHSKWKAATGS